MEISPEGCGVFATVIPVLLIAGHLDRAALLRISVAPILLRLAWFGWVVAAIFAMIMALIGAAGDGLSGGVGLVVFTATFGAATGIGIEVYARLFILWPTDFTPEALAEFELTRDVLRDLRLEGVEPAEQAQVRLDIAALVRQRKQQSESDDGSGGEGAE
jgi:hypothetical protein